ncbi:MAG: ComF family protein [Gammaproteobacteria bacterium]|nr:ComF family protein [Gammaproteobacteria bacterium]
MVRADDCDMRHLAIVRAAFVRATGVLRQLDDAIMPLRCVFCGTRLRQTEGRICGGCNRDLPWIGNACARCAEPVAVELPSAVHCAACQKREPLVEMTVTPLLYEFPVDAGLKALKFGRRLYYAPAFGELLLAQMPRLPRDLDALLPVPLHWRRQAFRGFNQAVELCKPLARRHGLPIIRSVVRRRATPYQSGLTAVLRRKNLRRAFVARNRLLFRHVLIVDDVVTTGETTRQLAATLIESGVRKVSVLAVARAV